MTAETVRIRAFAPEDAPALFDIYNQARPIEVAQLNEDRFWSWFADPALDAVRDILVAVDDQGPVGMIAAFPWPNHLADGYVFFVGPSVLPEFQAHGTGKLLLDSLAGEVRRRYPGKHLQTRLHQTNKRAHAFLTERMRFQVERTFWQMSHDAPGKVPQRPAPAGYAFGYLQPGENAAEVVETYGRILDDPAAGRHLLNPEELAAWASLGTFAPRSFQVARKDGKVVGICFISFPPGTDHAQVEFLGVVPSERGHGVATYLLAHALADAHATGKRSVKLEASDKGGVDVELYRRLGFETKGGEIFYEREA